VTGRRWIPLVAWVGLLLWQIYLAGPWLTHLPTAEWTLVPSEEQLGELRRLRAEQAPLPVSVEQTYDFRGRGRVVHLDTWLDRAAVSAWQEEPFSEFMARVRRDPDFHRLAGRVEDLPERLEGRHASARALGTAPRLPPPRWSSPGRMPPMPGARRPVWEDRCYPDFCFAWLGPGKEWWWRWMLGELAFLLLAAGAGVVWVRARGYPRSSVNR